MSRRWVIIALRRRSFVRWQGSDRNSSVWCADNELPFLSADAACICHLLFPPSLSFRTLSEDLQRFLRLFRIIRACFLDFRLLSMHFARLGSVLCSVATLFPFLSVEHNRGNVFRIFCASTLHFVRIFDSFCHIFYAGILSIRLMLAIFPRAYFLRPRDAFWSFRRLRRP